MDTSNYSKKNKELINNPLHGIYIPSFFILFGTLLFGWDKVIYGLLFIGLLMGFRFFQYKLAKGKKRVSASEFKPFELIDQTIITKDSAIYRFKLEEDEALDIPLGHHLGCSFTAEELSQVTDNVKEDDNDVVKYYTPISSKYDKGFFDLLVKSYPTGTVSKKFASLSVHQNVKIKGPVGRFDSEKYLTPDHCDKDKKVILIAGGSGITPFLRIIIESPMTMNFQLLYYSKTEKDVLLRNELDQVAEFKDTFDLKYLYGLLTEENLTENIDSSLDKSSSVLICGPPEFKKLAKKIVEELGFSETFLF
ncbi:hypothetical protein DASC09_039320 [Saccharomycopsis crataegensis]|uniref:FAD-binding FR-type domain-containing protein n=1 Tax=Saccharomycopsis crataegensis TaxID=43959 RepID=A0AAV5QQ27_9ASCO|nr:hypothetical protein DASC09_039320 [Saccharomycopsis crataegensis]